MSTKTKLFLSFVALVQRVPSQARKAEVFGAIYIYN